MVLIVIAIAALMTVPVLSFISDALHRARAAGESLQDVYATDAGFEDALWRLDPGNDDAFLDAVLSLTPQVYTINVGGQDVPVEVSINIPPDQTPTPVPTPTPKPGVNPWMWTFLDPPVVNIADDPHPTIRGNLYIYGTGAAQAHVYHIEYLLPVGWRYVEGSLEAEGFYSDNDGTPFPAEELEPSRIITCPGPIGGPDCPDATPPFPWEHKGPDPFRVVRSKCATKESWQNADEQRLEWSWSEGGGGLLAPRVDPGTMGHIWFDMTLESEVPVGRYWDDPWAWVNQQWCSGGGPKADLQAGAPASVIVGVTVNITATSEDGDTETASDVLVEDVSHILTYTSE